jgi:hypothetical protein
VSSLVVLDRQSDPFSGLSPSLLRFLHYDVDSLARSSLAHLRVSRADFMSAINIDDVNMDVPPSLLNNPRYSTFLKDMETTLRSNSLDKANFNFAVNAWRSDSPSINTFDWRLINFLTLPMVALQQVLDPALATTARFELPSAMFGLVKSVSTRAIELKSIFERFVFVMAKVRAEPVLLSTGKPTGAGGDAMFDRPEAQAVVKPAVNAALEPYYEANVRQQMYFPDRKLVQFDSGKLQTLCTLLYERKQGGHKCLIFTQMSKMLDILEAFLNIHGHTYVRLDGSTSVDRRQKLMDRFNNDPKLFCFILSTRSGGFGINLTGADSVIFYDSDWNPAMDAQAQDRAHRIGQTREVHIYRLVCSSTIEENILIKAKQKQHLDFLVMTEGNFSEASLFNANSVKDMLGISPDVAGSGSGPSEGSGENVEAAMAAAEDEEDIAATRGAREELAREGDEFDDNAAAVVGPASASAPSAGPGAEGDDTAMDIDAEPAAAPAPAPAEKISTEITTKGQTEEEIIEAEFQNWQKKVGNDFNAIENALKPIERYAYRFNTIVEPYYSLHFLLDQQRMAEMAQEAAISQEDEEWNVAEIERQKEEEEIRALEEGELLWAPMSEFDLKHLKRWYIRERAHRKREARRRVLTGEAWAEIVDPVTQMPFWYNEDTGDASYGTPAIVVEQRKIERARERGFMALPESILANILGMLTPKERMKSAELCAHWRVAASDERFYLRVLPVEAGASKDGAADAAAATDVFKKDAHATSITPGQEPVRLFPSLSAAVEAATEGDTICLCPGHFWEESIIITKPLKIIGCLEEPSKCALEITGQIKVLPNVRAVVFAGVSISRPRKIPTAKALITAENAGVDLYYCNINNRNGNGCGISLLNGSVLRLYSCTVKQSVYAGIQALGSDIIAVFCTLSENESHGVCLVDSSLSAADCYVTKNKARAVRAYGACAVALSHCDLSGNGASPAVSVDEMQDFDEPGDDVVICIRNSVGDIASDPPSRKWAGRSSAPSVASFSAEQITINAIIGQTIEVCTHICCYAMLLHEADVT